MQQLASAKTNDGVCLSLEALIKAKIAKVGVVGLGYVGLPLAVEMAKAKFPVTGIDLDMRRVKAVKEAKSYLGDVSNSDLRKVVKSHHLRATSDCSIMKDLDVIIICVPTPIAENKTPNLSFVEKAAQQVCRHLHAGELVVLESTTYPGTTEELVLPTLQSTGLRVGIDFFLAYSPERVDPGNKQFRIRNTPKIVGGVTKKCCQVAQLLYSDVADKVINVSSPKVAETTKLFENVFRNVNIALVNELSILCRRMGISVWEVLEAAATKPFGFTRFDPGPGVGGHCIPVDPYYLATKAREFDFHTRFIELSGEINENMPYHVVNLVSDALNGGRKAIRDSKVLVLGVTYKKDVDDSRESPALKIIRGLYEKGAAVSYNDPYIHYLHMNGNKLNSVDLNNTLLHSMDCVVIVADHSSYDYEEIVRESKLVVDTRNATQTVKNGRERIVRF